jgi:hypothetical protein
LFSGDESGRIVLWAITESKQMKGAGYGAATSATSSPAHGYSGRSSSRIVLTKLACWSTAMVGSFQCCYLDEVNGSAYVCFTDNSCNFSELWRISMRSGESLNNLGVSEPAAPLGKEKRKRRVSIDLDVKASVTNTSLDNAPSTAAGSDPKQLNFENLQLATATNPQHEGSKSGVGGLSIPFENSEELRAERKNADHSDSVQPTARSGKGGAANSSATCSRRSSIAAGGSGMTIFPSLLSIQLSFDTIATIKHDGIEPSCMRCRVGNSSLATQAQTGVTARGRSSKKEKKGNKGAETCVYMGLMDGSIQKHILGEVF